MAKTPPFGLFPSPIMPRAAVIAPGSASGTFVALLRCSASAMAFSVLSGPFTISGGNTLLTSGTAGGEGTTQTARIRATRATPFLQIDEDIVVTAASTVAPSNTVAPSISGTAQQGQVLTVANGTWLHAGAFTYQWFSGIAPISAATAQTYTPVLGDVGALLSCVVTSTNSIGATTASSAAVGPITAAPVGGFAHLGVSFSNDYSLEWPSGGGAGSLADSPNIVMSIRIRGNGSFPGGTSQDNRGTLNKVLCGSNTQTNTAPAHSAEQPQGALIDIDSSAGNNGGGMIRSSLGDTNVLTNGGYQVAFPPLAANIKNMEYFNITIAAQTNHANGQKLGALAIDGVQVQTFVEGGNWGSGSISNSVGKLMLNVWVAAVQGGADMDVARFYCDTPASMTGILDPTVGVGFAAGFLAKEFTPGVGAVDIGTDGSLWTGAAPKVFLEVRPGGVPTDIETNRGTLGNPTRSAFSGTTNAALKSPHFASVHPEEKTGEQPFNAWTPSLESGGISTDAIHDSLGNTGGYLVKNYGQEIRLNDLICVWFASGGVAPRAALACSSVNGGTWTKLSGVTATDDFTIWARTATSADIVAQGTNWGASNTNAQAKITWTPAGSEFGAGSSNATAGAFVIRKPSGNPVTVTSIAAVRSTFTIASPPTAGAITPPGSTPALLMDIIRAYGWQYEGNITPASGMIPRFKTTGGAYPYMFEKRVASASAIAARPYPTDGNGNSGVILTYVFS